MNLTQEEVDAFRAHVVVGDDCWDWSAARDKDGYGLFKLRGVTRRAHRIAYLAYVGSFDPKLHVQHRCDNPACCRPSHLFLGSQRDNVKDMMGKGRHVAPYGEVHWNRKITSQQRALILARRKEGALLREIAVEVNLSVSQVSKLARVDSWKRDRCGVPVLP